MKYYFFSKEFINNKNRLIFKIKGSNKKYIKYKNDYIDLITYKKLIKKKGGALGDEDDEIYSDTELKTFYDAYVHDTKRFYNKIKQNYFLFRENYLHAKEYMRLTISNIDDSDLQFIFKFAKILNVVYYNINIKFFYLQMIYYLDELNESEFHILLNKIKNINSEEKLIKNMNYEHHKLIDYVNNKVIKNDKKLYISYILILIAQSILDINKNYSILNDNIRTISSNDKNIIVNISDMYDEYANVIKALDKDDNILKNSLLFYLLKKYLLLFLNYVRWLNSKIIEVINATAQNNADYLYAMDMFSKHHKYYIVHFLKNDQISYSSIYDWYSANADETDWIPFNLFDDFINLINNDLMKNVKNIDDVYSAVDSYRLTQSIDGEEVAVGGKLSKYKKKK